MDKQTYDLNVFYSIAYDLEMLMRAMEESVAAHE